MSYLQLLLPDFSLILCGYLVCRYTALDRSVWEKVESLVYYFLFPVLLFHSIVKSPLDPMAASSLAGAGWALAAIGIGLAYALPHLPLLGRFIDRRQHAATAQIAFRFNSFVALALAERIAGPAGLAHTALLIGVCVPIFNVAAVWPMARQAGLHFGRELARNPLIIATLGGVLANLAGFTMPPWMAPTVARVGAASLALGLMAAGAGLQLTAIARTRVLGMSVLAIRHLLLPLAALLICHGFHLSGSQFTALVAFSALPTSSSAYVLATRMGYDGSPVAALVTLSTLLGMLSLPFALSVLR